MSDFAKVHNVVWDVDDDGSGYVVFRTGVHKTAQTAKRKRVLLPIIVPLRGVHGNAFGNELWQAFEDSAPFKGGEGLASSSRPNLEGCRLSGQAMR